MLVVGIAVAGAVGAPVRYVVDTYVSEWLERLFLWGTFVVNVTGSLLLGVLTGLALYHGFASTPKVILGTGFCGGYTTFSTFTYETMSLLGDGDRRPAVVNVVASVVVPALAAGAGLAVASL